MRATTRGRKDISTIAFVRRGDLFARVFRRAARYAQGLAICVMAAALAACGGGGSSASPSASSAKELTAFSIGGALGAIDATRRTIAIELPFGTDSHALVATFATTGGAVRVASTAQVSGKTPNDFNAPVTYIVTADDGSSVMYVVTVAIAASPAKTITAYSIGGTPGTIDEAAHAIVVTVPFGTDPHALVATFTTTGTSVTIGATVQASGTTVNDFASPVAYVVQAADGSTATYTLTVNIAESSAKGITAFSIDGSTGVIDATARTIDVEVPYATNVAAAVATFSTSGASVSVSGILQASGNGTNDFSHAVTYVVTAADGSNATWVVAVAIAPPPTYAIGGTVTWPTIASGNGLVLQDNGADDLALTSANSTFVFASRLSARAAYAVRVKTSADFTRCAVANASGVVTSADIVDVAVTCTQWTVSTLAGGSVGTGSQVGFSSPRSVAVDKAGNVFVADAGNNMVRKITPSGVLSNFAGSGSPGAADGIGAAASFNYPTSVAVDSAGNVYVADGDNHKIRKISSAGVVTTLAGSGAIGSQEGVGIAASFNQPYGIAVDAAGNVYVADLQACLVRKITSTGVVTTLAGSGSQGFVDGVGTAASFNDPNGIAVDGSGNVFLADTLNHAIRKITPEGIVSTYAGGQFKHPFTYPYGVAVDANGNVYVGNTSGNDVRVITPYGGVNIVAGSQTSGDADGPGASATFYSPMELAVDASGNVYVADFHSAAVRMIH
jgi:serine/threonine protein kinase, bacterial